MQNAGLDESQPGVRIVERNINSPRYADNTTIMAKSREKIKSLLRVKEESEKVGLKLHVQRTEIMACSPITVEGGKVEAVADFIFLGSRITADGACSHEIKRHLPLRRKALANLDSVLKSKDVTSPTKVCTVKAVVFPVVMYGCENWTIKEAEH